MKYIIYRCIYTYIISIACHIHGNVHKHTCIVLYIYISICLYINILLGLKGITNYDVRHICVSFY